MNVREREFIINRINNIKELLCNPNTNREKINLDLSVIEGLISMDGIINRRRGKFKYRKGEVGK